MAIQSDTNDAVRWAMANTLHVTADNYCGGRPGLRAALREAAALIEARDPDAVVLLLKVLTINRGIADGILDALTP